LKKLKKPCEEVLMSNKELTTQQKAQIKETNVDHEEPFTPQQSAYMGKVKKDFEGVRENLTAQLQAYIEDFHHDTDVVVKQTEKFLKLVYPSYLVDEGDLESHMDKESTLHLASMTFFRINSCTADNVDKIFENVNERFEKLFTALYSIHIPVAYGLISRDGITNLVLGVYSKEDVETVKAITEGMLFGIELSNIVPNFSVTGNKKRHQGILTGVPSLYVKEQKQTFSLSPIMRSLNGQNYTLLFIAKPVSNNVISQNISELISVRDEAFAVSKRNVARASSFSETTSGTVNVNDTKNNVAGSVGGGSGAAVGASIGTVIQPGVGTVVGGTIGGGLGTVIGNVVGQGESHSEGYSESISGAITAGTTIAGDIQNGFAIELMNFANNAIERLKGGQNSGIWQTAIAYSAESEISRNIIRACLSGELSKVDAEKLPMLAFKPKASKSDTLRIPAFFEGNQQNPLCTYINSAELGLLCTVPTESVPDFELKIGKKFPLIASRFDNSRIKIGNVVDGKRPLDNMPFGLSERDLNKHTFVCGITGSGKTTTVKKILVEAKKPFLIIESAKKEYRNIATDTLVYTLGKPEINAPKINPFYIMPGVSPQVHIDFLKDLFNASFSFYGPMPYILEKCLHTVYRNKGWDLTFGYHPMLVNTNSTTDFFNIEHTKAQYAKQSHHYLFPTMQELKNEISRYVEEELKYDGEVAGNVKTAMKVRLENLCVGAKGYTFNTSEFIDFETLLGKNVIFELEGLADDSDKAFSVGLLVIFINEYRQVQKEISGNQQTTLNHLLVIEEAHRLLKNVDTERSTETSGNPKGKAVEHFTNMIAEMRSYGQGVIVAEQIPTKLAPDVIKNSSTKIVQRIVSADDQQAIANTIGISTDDAIQLGSLETGYAFCHKEGMVLPTLVKISDKFMTSYGEEKGLDVFVSDEELYNSNDERFDEINLSILRSAFGGDCQIKRKVLGFLNTLMFESESVVVSSCDKLMEYVTGEIKQKDIRLTFADDTMILAHLTARFLTELTISMMVRGVYQSKVLLEDDFIELLEQTLYAPTENKITRIKTELQVLYSKNLTRYALDTVSSLIRLSLKKETDISGTIREYFICVSNQTVAKIEKKVKGGEVN